MDIEAVSEELCGLPLDDSIAARTEREKQAHGEQDLAALIISSQSSTLAPG